MSSFKKIVDWTEYVILSRIPWQSTKSLGHLRNEIQSQPGPLYFGPTGNLNSLIDSLRLSGKVSIDGDGLTLTTLGQKKVEQLKAVINAGETKDVYGSNGRESH